MTKTLEALVKKILCESNQCSDGHIHTWGIEKEMVHIEWSKPGEGKETTGYIMPIAILEDYEDKKDIPQFMMEMLRGRRGLEDDDTSQDEKIKKMSPEKIVKECTAWQLGDSSWATVIAEWMAHAQCSVEDLTKNLIF